jgi:hypothetical protein
MSYFRIGHHPLAILAFNIPAIRIIEWIVVCAYGCGSAAERSHAGLMPEFAS